jgi:hypothetical protein
MGAYSRFLLEPGALSRRQAQPINGSDAQARLLLLPVACHLSVLRFLVLLMPLMRKSPLTLAGSLPPEQLKPTAQELLKSGP